MVLPLYLKGKSYLLEIDAEIFVNDTWYPVFASK